MLKLDPLTSPSTQPVGLPQIKDHLRIDHTDEDAHLTLLAKAATEWAEGIMHRQILARQWRMSMDGFPAGSSTAWGSVINLPMGHTLSVDLVTYVDSDGAEQTLTGPSSSPAGTDYEEYLAATTGGCLWPAYGTSWPSTREQPGAVRVDFTAGWGTATSDVPPDVIHAVLFRIADMYESRAGEDMRMAQNFPASAYAQAAHALLEPYVIRWAI